MKLRPFVLLIHRWLGLASSVVLSIVGVTGAFYAWPWYLPLRRTAGALHERLALGRPGSWIVAAATGAAVIIQVGGLFLWWKRRTLRVRMGRGWRRALDDLHHAAGALGSALMLTLAVSGLGMVFVKPRSHPNLRRDMVVLHTTNGLSTPVKLAYVLATNGFLIQGVTGVVMWWGRRSAEKALKDGRNPLARAAVPKG